MIYDDSGHMPSRSRAWAGVIILSLFFVVSLLDRNLVSLLAEPIKREMKISDTQIGLLYGAAFSTFYIIAALPIGWALDRFSRRGVIWAGTVVWSLGTVGCGLVGNFTALFATRGIVGAGEAAISPGAHSIIAETFPRDKLALPMSVYSIGAKAGSGLSFLIGGLLTLLIDPDLRYVLPILGERSGWQTVFIVAGLPGILFAFLIFLVYEPKRTAGASTDSTSIKGYMAYLRAHWSFFLPLHVATTVLYAAMAAAVIWAPASLSRLHGLKASEAGIWLSVALTIGPILTMPLHGFFVDRLFAKGQTNAHLRYLSITAAISTPFMIATYLAPTAWLTITLLGLTATILSGYVGLPTSALQLTIPRHSRSKASSVLMIFQAIGTMIGAAGPAFVNDNVFVEPTKIGVSIAIVAGTLTVLGVVSAAFAARKMRGLVEAQAA